MFQPRKWSQEVLHPPPLLLTLTIASSPHRPPRQRRLHPLPRRIALSTCLVRKMWTTVSFFPNLACSPQPHSRQLLRWQTRMTGRLPWTNPTIHHGSLLHPSTGTPTPHTTPRGNQRLPSLLSLVSWSAAENSASTALMQPRGRSSDRRTRSLRSIRDKPVHQRLRKATTLCMVIRTCHSAVETPNSHPRPRATTTLGGPSRNPATLPPIGHGTVLGSLMRRRNAEASLAGAKQRRRTLR